MAERIQPVKRTGTDLRFAVDRVGTLLNTLELIAAGDTEQRLPISGAHDELDAMAYGINVLVGELGWSSARAIELQEQRAAELRAAVANAERANAAKNIFLRNVSHEIRTPIAAMLGCADLLSMPDLSQPERADLVGRLQANGQAVLSLLSDLLDLARLDAEKVLLTPEPVSVIDLVREVLASVEIESHAKGLEVRIEITNDALGCIQTDRYRLRQILVNLVTNAIKFTETGTITIALRKARIVAGDQLIVDVSDTGIGIDVDRHAQLFEPFEQADASIAPTFGGTGLGLALSRRLAERLGGSLILMHSAPNEGTTFRLTVNQLAADTNCRSRPDSSAPLQEAADVRGLRILLADDHADIQHAVRRLLELAGAFVEVVPDGVEAVAKVRSREFDVVLMDLRMPNMDGLEATRVLRSEGYQLPVVALTADPAIFRRTEAYAAGCDYCLSKPFTLGELAAAIRSASARPVANRLEAN